MRVVRPATLKINDEARIARSARIKSMAATDGAFDPPARRGGASRWRGCMGDEKAGRFSRSCRQAEAPGGRQSDVIQDAENEAQAFRLQSLFQRQQRVAGARRLDENQAVGIKPEPDQTGSGWAAKLAGQHLRPAPQSPGLMRSRVRFQSVHPADGETQAKAYARGPIASRRARPKWHRLNFMDGIGLKAVGQQPPVGLRAAKLPDGLCVFGARQS